MNPVDSLNTIMKTIEANEARIVQHRHWLVFLYFPTTSNIVAFDSSTPMRMFKEFMSRGEEPLLLDMIGMPNSAAALQRRNEFNNNVNLYKKFSSLVAADPEAREIIARKQSPAVAAAAAEPISQAA